MGKIERLEQGHLNEFEDPKESVLGQIQTYSGPEEGIYDVYKLIALAKLLPEETVSVGALAAAVFKEKVWTDARGRMVGAGELFEIIEKNKGENAGAVSWGKLQEEYPDLAYHFEKVRIVDYTTPILLLGEYSIVDGFHRLLKAKIDGVNELKTKRFTELPTSALLSDELLATLNKA